MLFEEQITVCIGKRNRKRKITSWSSHKNPHREIEVTMNAKQNSSINKQMLICFGLILVLIIGLTVIGWNKAREGEEIIVIIAGIAIGVISIGVAWYLIQKLSTGFSQLKIGFESMITSSTFSEDEKSKLLSRNDSFSEIMFLVDKVQTNNAEKLYWYEGLLDAIPFPLSVTDMNMNWTFINKPVEGMLGIKRADVLGHQCSDWNANICKTENCGIARLRKNFLETFFDQGGGNFRVDTSYLYNLKGEKVGHVEVVQDISKLVASTRYQEKAVQVMAGYLHKMAEGNLDFQVEPLPEADQNSKDARANFETINSNLSSARTLLNDSIKEIQRNSVLVTTSSDQLAAASNQAGEATSQIASTIQQIAKGTSQQSEAVSKTAELLEEVNRTVSGVAEGVRQQSRAVGQAGDVSSKIASKDGISARVKLSAEKVQEMGDRSQKIGAIVETIDDIASQTNLLALNAAIEAARAGEHGKGFAVVADEVRKLAERSSSATKEIGGLISSIQKSVNEAVEIATSAAEELGGASGALETAISGVSTVVSENTEATNRLTTTSSGVMQAIENIASVSEENSAAVEEVSASTEEMTAQVEEVTASAQSLAEMAKAMREAVDHFVLSV
jgi:methyl-accepting chemotaxis protein